MRYLWNEKTHRLELIGSGFKDPNAGLNGPVWCPEQGYFDPALNKHFNTKREKRAYMREHGLMMQGESSKIKQEGQGIKTYYSFPGQKTKSRGYKYR